MRFPITSTILFASLSSVVTAQFGFFDHMFGAHQGQQQRQQQPHAGSQWTAHAETGSCGLLACLNDGTFTQFYSPMLLIFVSR